MTRGQTDWKTSLRKETAIGKIPGYLSCLCISRGIEEKASWDKAYDLQARNRQP